jgi:hypothetical protein
VPIQPEVLGLHIDSHGRFLYHVTGAQNVENIMNEGLAPASETGQLSREDFHQARPGRVYLLDIRSAPLVLTAGERSLLSVDLTRLDPARFDTDEDLAQGAGIEGDPWVSTPAPRRDLDDNEREMEGQRGRLAKWAEETCGFDAPDVVAKSLAGGRVAYQGTIPRGALRLVEIPSEGASRFCTAVHDVLAIEDADLPPLPLLAYWKVEVALAYALADTIVDRALLVADVTKPESATVRDVGGALDLGGDLSRQARQLNRSGNVARAGLVQRASSIAKRAADLGELGWPHRRKAVLELASAAAEALGEINTIAGHNSALDVAVCAIEEMRAAS